jgi:hypothetical protein
MLAVRLRFILAQPPRSDLRSTFYKLALNQDACEAAGNTPCHLRSGLRLALASEALYFAAYKGYTDVMSLLLDAGADMNEDGGHTEVIAVLNAHGGHCKHRRHGRREHVSKGRVGVHNNVSGALGKHAGVKSNNGAERRLWA